MPQCFKNMSIETVPLFPEQLGVEMTSKCNYKCVMCGAHGIGSFVGNNVQEPVLARLEPFISNSKTLQLNGVGEPLLSKSFWHLIKKSGEKNKNIQFATNGSLFTDENIKRLIEAKPSWISVSLDAAHQETYRKIRGGDLSRVLEGIWKFLRAAEAKPIDNLRFSLGFVLMEENIRELPDFVSIAHYLGVKEIILAHLVPIPEKILESWLVARPDGWQFNYKEQQLINNPRYSDAYLLLAFEKAERLSIAITGENLLLSVTDNQNVVGVKKWSVNDCRCPWTWLYVSEDGKAKPCCYGNYFVGNIVDRGPEAVWHGEILNSIRSDIANGRIGEYCAGAGCRYVRDSYL